MPTFNELGLNHLLVQAVEALGFKEPMPVQAEVIPTLVESPVDLVGLAQTGTGKTAAFGLPLLHHINADLHKTQALILCPTRELCLQIARDLESFAAFMPSIQVTAVYGGASIEIQIRQLQQGPQIIVATPGRLNDMIRRKRVDFSNVRWVVLDEADEMLDMGFQEEVDTILETTPKEKNTLLFSATLPSEVERILTKYMTNPIVKTVGKRNTSTANVKHLYYLVHARDRYLALKRIADFNPNIYAIIFCRTRIETQEIADSLIRDGYNADSLHGDLSQAQRDHVMSRFRNRTLQMLVATDVAARGLDVNDLTHVINYNLPDDTEVYIHRSGRTGRADKLGVSIAIINLKEKFKIRQIEKMIGREFAQAKIPTGFQVCEKQLFHYIDRMENVDIDAEIESFLPVIDRKLEWMSKEDIIRRFVSLEFNRFLEYYRDARDINVEEEKREPREQRDRADSRGRGRDESRRSESRRGDDRRSDDRRSDDRRGSSERSESGFSKGRGREAMDDKNLTRMFVSIGRKDKVMPQQLIGLINEVTKTREIKIGRIDIMDSYSFIDIDSGAVKKVLKAFTDENRNPDGVRIEVAGDRPAGDRSERPGRSEGRGGEGRGSEGRGSEGRGPGSYRSPKRDSGSRDERPRRDDGGFRRSDSGFKRDDRKSSYDRGPKTDRKGRDNERSKPRESSNDQSLFESPWKRNSRKK
ncbi:MAG TPA: DEAD/DEAH box helicase [Lentimicrobium sp.]|nr:DEAD/DEAH box helicase [Lentimicrobium sp.]